MTEVHPEPTICCCDLWPPGTLTLVKQAAYRSLIELGDVRIRRVVHHRPSGFTTVEYWSGLPHAFILRRLRETAQLLDPGNQTRMEV